MWLYNNDQQSHDLGSVCYRPRHRMAFKRKLKVEVVQPDPNHTASTLKEYISNELLLILRTHSYVSLRGKQTSDTAMWNFPWVTLANSKLSVDNTSCRGRIWSNLQSHVQMMESAAKPCAGDPVTSAEFRRVTLTVAYTLVNPCEFNLFFMSQYIWSISTRSDRVGCYATGCQSKKYTPLGQWRAGPGRYQYHETF